MSIRVLATNAFWSLLNHLLSRGSIMLAAVFLARTLNTADFSAYSYFQLTVTMLAAYAGMGMGTTASRYFASIGLEKDNKANIQLGLFWAVSISFAFIAFTLVYLIPTNWIDAGFPIPKWLFALGVLTLALQVVPSGAVMGLEQYKQASIISIISGSCMLLGAAIAIHYDSALLAMGAIIFASAVQLLGESAIVFRVIGWRNIVKRTEINWNALRKIFSFVGPMLVVSLIAASGAWVLGRIIAHATGDRSFALYSIGMQWFSLALVMPSMISRVILPRVVRTKSSTIADRQRLVKQGAMIAALTAALIFSLGTLLSQQIINFYGHQYSDYRWLVSAYLAAAMLIAPANTMGNAIIANDKQMSWLLLISTWILTLLSTGFLTTQYGPWSGAIAHAIAGATLSLSSIYFARLKKII